MNDGWIKIHRQLLSWEWFDKPEMVQLFLYLLLKANPTDKVWHGITIKRGQFLTSAASIKRDLGMSERTIRTCLTRLKTTHEVTIETTNRYTIVTICNYDRYQIFAESNDKQIDEQKDNQTTSQRQASDKRPTTTKEYKNIRNTEDNITMAYAIASSGDDTGLAGDEKIDFDSLLKFINQTFDKTNSSIPRIKTISGQRKTMVVARIKEHGKESFRTVIKKAAKSSFLNGGGNKGFKADFFWIIRPNNFIKILEGNYDNDRDTDLTTTTQNRQLYGTTEQGDKFSKRRGVDTAARSPEDYTGTL